LKEHTLTATASFGRLSSCERENVIFTGVQFSKRRAKAVGLDYKEFSSHSLRSGLITAAAQAGVAERVIAKQSGHKSLPVLRRYIREGSLFTENAAAQVGLQGGPLLAQFRHLVAAKANKVANQQVSQLVYPGVTTTPRATSLPTEITKRHTAAFLIYLYFAVINKKRLYFCLISLNVPKLSRVIG
jgi:hypothetical protein